MTVVLVGGRERGGRREGWWYKESSIAWRMIEKNNSKPSMIYM
jgi:hypothetical protein